MDMIAVITAAAKAVSLPPAFLLSVCFVETGHRNLVHQDDGGTPSLGVCQVKTATAQMFDKRATDTALMDPVKNARFAARYLAKQLKRYGDFVCAAAAYNKGSVRLDTNSTNCHTKYSRKVMKTWKEESWKTKPRKRKQAQGRARSA